ncbi:cytochrome P450 [Lepidopterella palustris CBS 459.81]|uniref:Cytochrome P450 n=1 Tax=Lepidopterella palustris CBS 459.81 TaxID=1314670 RepID=A0A8E2DZD1_9PEZI|nr:cytochrome P450 [Lepidopterella palustris CBS 459.81]
MSLSSILPEVLCGASRLPLSAYVLLAIVAATVPTVFIIVYNIYLSPLRIYPGPKSSAATSLPYLRAVITGTTCEYVYKLHQKYGDVVRISPNELSYTSSQAWRDINAHRPGFTLPDKEEAFYMDPPNAVPSLFSSKNHYHPRLRRPLAHAFSEKALRDQDGLIRVYIDALVNGLKEKATQGEVIDISAWLNWTTFDVMGELSFGEPFDCLKDRKFHPWVRIIFDTVRATAIMGGIRRYPGAQRIVEFFVPAAQKALPAKHQKMTDEKVARRLTMGAERPDFMTSLLKNKDNENALTEPELSSALFATIVAGSETTATALTATILFLCRNLDKYEKLKQEIRTAFKSADEINMLSTMSLRYTTAVLEESMRVYPPVPIGMPRVIPKGGLTVLGKYLPAKTIVSVHQYASYHSPKYWRDPEKFAPERWLDDPYYADDDRRIFQPFSLGARNCIGQNLAYAEMRSILARLVLEFDVELDDINDPWLAAQKTYIIWEKGPLKVKFSHAKKTTQA